LELRWRKGRKAGEDASQNFIRVTKSRKMRWAGHVAHMGSMKNAYRILVGKSEGKRLLGRPRRRWEDNIIMELRKIGRGNVNWIYLAQDRDQ
jgi:hypothetical protein